MVRSGVDNSIGSRRVESYTFGLSGKHILTVGNRNRDGWMNGSTTIYEVSINGNKLTMKTVELNIIDFAPERFTTAATYTKVE